MVVFDDNIYIHSVFTMKKRLNPIASQIKQKSCLKCKIKAFETAFCIRLSVKVSPCRQDME